jgi:hypothetical protein
VLGVREPTEEIVRSIVERFFDEMVADTEVGFAFTVNEGRAFSVEDLTHEDVAKTRMIASQIRCRVPAIFGFCAHFGRVLMCNFLPMRIDETGASLMCPQIETRMLAITGKIKCFIHNTPPIGGMFVPKGGAKVEVWK